MTDGSTSGVIAGPGLKNVNGKPSIMTVNIRCLFGSDTWL